ncbi:MAG: hypothetical protein ACE5O2_05950, partial [Armatimonadota bacterium]
MSRGDHIGERHYSRKMNRREFVRRTALGAIGAGAALQTPGTAFGQRGAPKPSRRPVRKGDMVYRR